MTDAAPAPQPKRGRGRPGYDAATVLRIAIEVFNERGFDATSMEDLGKALGMSKSAIYYHVPNKETLLESALNLALDELTRVLDEEEAARMSGAITARDSLQRVIERSVAVLIEHKPSVTLLLRVHGNTEVEKHALRRRREIDQRTAALVSMCIDDGSLRDDLAPLVVSRLLFGMVNSLIEWYRPERETSATAARDIAHALTQLAFEGLTPRS